MAFKITRPGSPAAISPEALLRDLKTKKIAGPLADQADIWRAYVAEAVHLNDVALHLPTGGGKTLVGVMLAEWRRRQFGERVVYLCPTRQLANQVAFQASERFGVPVALLVGSKKDYDRSTSSLYRSGERVAVTTYSSLFNVSPFFDDANILLLDDAHASEQYISKMWSLEVKKYEAEDRVIYDALVALLRPTLPFSIYNKLVSDSEDSDRGWVDKLPTPAFLDISKEVVAMLDQLIAGGEKKFVWSLIRDHLAACHFYLSSSSFLIRPILPPTATHAPFNSPKQRIYMSATPGEAGELERITGRFPITRLSPSLGWERQTIGRRYFMMPDRSLGEDEQVELCTDLINKSGRAVVLCPDDRRARAFSEIVSAKTIAKIFSAKDIERSKSDFTSCSSAVAVLSNRYDGIDFPEEEARLLIVEGLPKATNLQESFFVSRLGSSDILRVRILTRIVQAFGRCTRSDKDYAAVLIRGEELSKYLLAGENLAPLHPELQAELRFGIEQSKESTKRDFCENLVLFLQQGDDWRAANEAIVEDRETREKQVLDGASDLSSSVKFEIEYINSIWFGDYPAAFGAARSVLGALGAVRLRGYRALWHYLAGSTAWISHELDGEDTAGIAREHYGAAKKAERMLSWLGNLSRIGLDVDAGDGGYDEEVATNVERIEALFDRLGTLTDFKFSKFEAELRTKISSNSAKDFERGHVMLGELLGYEAGNRNEDASPDPWWKSTERFCLVFEDYTDAQSGCIPASKARQAATHPNWVRSEQLVSGSAEVVSLMISPCKQQEVGAAPHMAQVIHWDLEDFRQVAAIAISILRDIRTSYPGPGDLAWRADAMRRLNAASLSPRILVSKLRSEQVSLEVRGIRQEE